MSIIRKSLALGILLILLGVLLSASVELFHRLSSPQGPPEVTGPIITRIQIALAALGATLVLARHWIAAHGWAATIVSVSFIVTIQGFVLLALSVPAFIVLESSPKLIRWTGLNHVRYFAYSERNLRDPVLVIRKRPNYHTRVNPEFRGDLYSPKFGVEAEPVPIQVQATFDTEGFRNPPGLTTVAIAVLGDSYIEAGITDQDSFSRRLQKETGLRTANFGVAWYGPFQYLEVLQRYALPKSPKIVLFCFYEGNDARDIRAYLKWRQGGFYHVYPPDRLVYRYSVAMRDIGHRLASIVNDSGPVTVPPPRVGVHPQVAELQLGDQTVLVKFGKKNDLRTPAELLASEEWIELEKILIEFRDLAVANGIRPVLVFIPTKAHVYAAFSTASSGRHWLSIRDQQVAARANRMEAFIVVARRVDLQVINLAPRFESLAGEGQLLYYPFDSHWNSQGRQVAAEVVAESLSLKMRQRTVGDIPPKK